MAQKHFLFVHYAAVGRGLSGSDRIAIELGRRIKARGFPLRIVTNGEGRAMYQRAGAGDLHFVLWPKGPAWRPAGFAAKTIRALRGKLPIADPERTVVYSASDFLPDSLPAWQAKRRWPSLTWAAGFYLFAPSPFRGFQEQARLHLPRPHDLLYWLLQQPSLRMIHRAADIVCVTSEPDREAFITDTRPAERILVIRGGAHRADSRAIEQFPPFAKRLFDALFIGRLHPQKGVLELVEIWRKVVRRRPTAQLAIIGDGPLERALREKIKAANLHDHVSLFGFRDGEEKVRIIQNARIVLHPAVYDSGGMAAAEAMAYGLPGVAFDLRSLKSYYPKGMLKVAVGDLEGFASAIIELLEDGRLYRRLGGEARACVEELFDWDERTVAFLEALAQ